MSKEEMVVTLELIRDVYTLPDAKGKQKCIKRNVKYNKTFDTNFIQAEHFIDSRGNISKKYCLVYEGDNAFKANHKFEYVEKLIKPLKINGFKNT